MTMDEIQKLPAQHFQVDQSEMRSKRRARAVVRPRQIAMYLAKKMTPRSLPALGRIFGGRDHSTVIHAVRTIESLRAPDDDTDADIRAINQIVGAMVGERVCHDRSVRGDRVTKTKNKK